MGFLKFVGFVLFLGIALVVAGMVSVATVGALMRVDVGYGAALVAWIAGPLGALIGAFAGFFLFRRRSWGERVVTMLVTAAISGGLLGVLMVGGWKLFERVPPDGGPPPAASARP